MIILIKLCFPQKKQKRLQRDREQAQSLLLNLPFQAVLPLWQAKRPKVGKGENINTSGYQ